jgi:peptide subunit release factor 1 (eRF1)
MDLKDRMTELARITKAATPVVSVYLGTRWMDEHQRDRVRIFLKNELAQARRAGHPRAADADLDWVEAQGEGLLSHATVPEASGVALFACEALGLREVLRSRLPFENAFAVAEAPLLRPLAELDEKAPSTLVVFIDMESARLVALTSAGAEEEVVLEANVPEHPNPSGGSAQTTESRYRRHLQDHRTRHFEAVVESLIELVQSHDLKGIVLAGDPRNIAALREELPPRVAERIVGTVEGARHEPMGAIVARAAQLAPHAEGQRAAAAVDAVLTTAAKRGKAAAGLEATLQAVNRGAVHRLYLLKGFNTPGRVCAGCGALQSGDTWKWPDCGGEATSVELGEAMAERVAAMGGTVETIEAHQLLAAVGGIAAELRYPLGEHPVY